MKHLVDYIKENKTVELNEVNRLLVNCGIEHYDDFQDFYESNKISDDVVGVVERAFYEYKYRGGTLFSEGLCSYFFEYTEKTINENLGNSLSLGNEKFIGLIEKLKGVVKIIKNSEFQAIITVDDNFDVDGRQFTSLLNLYNFFIQKKNGNDIYIEGRKPIKIENTFDFLYHVTTKSKLSKIKKVGLCPHKKNEFYPYRTYLFTPSQNVRSYISMFVRMNKAVKNIPDDDIVILKVKSIHDIMGYKHPITLYKDPSYNIKNAVFTLENIPSSYIEVIDINNI